MRDQPVEPFQDQNRAQKGSKMLFSKSEGGPLGMLMQVFLAYPESTSTLFSRLAHALTHRGCTNFFQPSAHYFWGDKTWANKDGDQGTDKVRSLLSVDSVQYSCPHKLSPYFSPGWAN